MAKGRSRSVDGRRLGWRRLRHISLPAFYHLLAREKSETRVKSRRKYPAGLKSTAVNAKGALLSALLPRFLSSLTILRSLAPPSPPLCHPFYPTQHCACPIVSSPQGWILSSFFFSLPSFSPFFFPLFSPSSFCTSPYTLSFSPPLSRFVTVIFFPTPRFFLSLSLFLCVCLLFRLSFPFSVHPLCNSFLCLPPVLLRVYRIFMQPLPSG